MMAKIKPKVILLTFVTGMLSFLFLLTDKAISYSDNAKFCLNCHTMQEPYETLQDSGHRQFKCTECHTPNSYIPKVVFKTKAGLHDLYVTTLGEVPQVLQATDETKKIITANCIRCHQTTVEHTGIGQDQMCTNCHRNLVHD